jgi:hypothetical protein
MSELFPLDEVERAMLGLGEEVIYSYRCLQCEHEDVVPDVVIDGFIGSGGVKSGEMPRLVCPVCGGSFCAVDDSSRERSER